MVRMTSRKVQRAAYWPEDVICTQGLALDQAMKRIRARLTHTLARLQIRSSSAVPRQTYQATVSCLRVAVAGQHECVPGRQGRVHGHMFLLGAPVTLPESILQVQVVRSLQYPARLRLCSSDVGMGSPLHQNSPSGSAQASKEDCQHHLIHAVIASRQVTHHCCSEQTPETGLLEMGKQ